MSVACPRGGARHPCRRRRCLASATSSRYRLRRAAAVSDGRHTPCLCRAAHRAGPILEDEGITIGVVEGVQGISWTELTISGRSAHAGTTPMNMRRDAGLVAAAIAVFVRQLATGLGGAQVATVGRFEVRPDPRERRAEHGDPHGRPAQHRRRRAASGRSRLADEVVRLAAAEGASRTRSLARFEPARLAATATLVESTARRLGQLDAPHAERRRSRRPDARPHLPGGDDLHAERRGLVAQHRRHPPGRRSPPGRTCSCRRCWRSPHLSMWSTHSDRLAQGRRAHSDEVARGRPTAMLRGPVTAAHASAGEVGCQHHQRGCLSQGSRDPAG